MKTRSGARFEAPKGWSVEETGRHTILTNPERDASVTLVEISGEADGARAIAAAWKRAKPDFTRVPKQTLTPPPKDGWDAITQIVYETGAEQRSVVALARRKGAVEYIALMDGTNAGLDRRGAQLATILSTFKAPGVEEEVLAGRTAHALDEPRRKRLEAFIADTLTRARIPGAAIAVVQGGKVVYQKAFGVREHGKKAPVTDDTLFMIGSTTKSLTTLLMARLVDEGKFGWDTPVAQLLPSFALGDPEITKTVRMQHTVCACTGLPRQDMEFLFEYAKATPEQRMESMRAMRPTTGFGETFQYSNTMVAAGGYAAAHTVGAEKKLGPAYDEAMRSRLFEPLGMTRSTLELAAVKARDHASPHAHDIELQYRSLPLSDEGGVVSVRPAGAAWSTAGDMAKYLLLELTKGRDSKGRVVVSEENLRRRYQPEIKITDKVSYGLGLFVEDDHGLKIVHHGGNNLGFTSDMFFMPDHGIGVVWLTNANGANAVRASVRRRLIELLFDAKEQAEERLHFALTQRHEAVQKELASIVEPDEAWIRGHVGVYENATLGRIEIRREGREKKRAVLDAGEWKSAVGRKRVKDGTDLVVLVAPPLAGLEFHPVDDGAKRSLVLEASQQRYVFVRRDDRASL